MYGVRSLAPACTIASIQAGSFPSDADSLAQEVADTRYRRRACHTRSVSSRLNHVKPTHTVSYGIDDLALIHRL